MNEFLPSRFSEGVKHLALGLEPMDAQLQQRIAQGIEVAFDTAPLKLPRPPIDHHRTGLHVVLYDRKLKSPVDLRFFDSARRFVPRRLRIPIFLTRDAADAQPFSRRVRRPFMFPGAGYDATGGATGLRGRVMRGGAPMRWARVEARLIGGGVLVGRAHGDDRGEFLLLIGTKASPHGDLNAPLQLDVTVLGRAAVATPPTPDTPKIDPLWDLPLEPVAAPGEPDPVSAGESRPRDYTAQVITQVDLILGRVLSGKTFTIR
jgi:hypothetical protein